MPYITRNDVNVHYESFGRSQGGKPAIVFLHPWSTNRYIWSFQILKFARDHQCVVVDHRGHGMSDKPDSGYAIGEMAADVALSEEAMKAYPFCRLSGPANVLVMPARHSASISTKMLQQLEGTTVIGPILTGVEKPVQICSMGSTVSDILNMAVIAATEVG